MEPTRKVGDGGRGGEAVNCVSSLPFLLFSLILRKSGVEAKGEINMNVSQEIG